MGTWTTEVRSDAAVFAELAEWWDVQPAAREIPFLTSAVLGCWQDGFAEADSRLRVRLLRRRGELVAAMPLFLTKGRLRSIGRELIEPYDVVALDDPEVTEYLPRWIDRMTFAHLYLVRSGSPIVAAVPNRRRWWFNDEQDSHVIDLSRGWEVATSAMQPGLRKSLRRRRRRLEELGEVTYVEHRRLDGDGRRLFEDGLRLEAAGWKGRIGAAVVMNPPLEGWYRALAPVLEDLGWLRLGGLFVDDRLVAFAYDFEAMGGRYSDVSAYDEDGPVARCSPGLLLLEHAVAAASRAGLHRYELGAGAEAWKREWTPHANRVYDVIVFGSGPSGRAAHALRTLRDQRRRRIRPEA